MTSPLDNLARTTVSLRREPPDAGEYAGLIRSATVRLIDAENLDNSIESRFDLAYNAAHALCLAAMRHAGYRAHNRYVVFQGEYEGDLDVDARLVADLIVACKKVAKAVAQLAPIA